MKKVLTLILTLMWLIPAILFLIAMTVIAFMINPIFGILFVIFTHSILALSLIVNGAKMFNNRNNKL